VSAIQFHARKLAMARRAVKELAARRNARGCGAETARRRDVSATFRRRGRGIVGVDLIARLAAAVRRA